MLKRNFISIGLLSLLVVFAFANPVASQQSEKLADVKKSTESQPPHQSGGGLKQNNERPENANPGELNARGPRIGGKPNGVKSCLGFGGQRGKRLISQRREDGRWSPPAYIAIAGGSFG